LKQNKISKDDFKILDQKIDENIKKLNPSIPMSSLKVAQPITIPTQSSMEQPKPQRVAKCHKCDGIIKIYADEIPAIVKCPNCGEEVTI
jgi:hypothetical protein